MTIADYKLMIFRNNTAAFFSYLVKKCVILNQAFLFNKLLPYTTIIIKLFVTNTLLTTIQQNPRRFFAR